MPDEKKPETPARRGLDPELQAVAKIDRILAALDREAAHRILLYLASKQGITILQMNRKDPE